MIQCGLDERNIFQRTLPNKDYADCRNEGDRHGRQTIVSLSWSLTATKYKGSTLERNEPPQNCVPRESRDSSHLMKPIRIDLF